MTDDLLQQLADVEVPVPPDDFDRQVHQRLNVRLLLAHLAELALCGLPMAFLYFSRAFLGLVIYSVTGRFDVDRRRDRD